MKLSSDEDCNRDYKFSTSQLVVQAISASKKKQLSSSEIYDYITENHAEYKKAKTDISNALLTNRCHSDNLNFCLSCFVFVKQ